MITVVCPNPAIDNVIYVDGFKPGNIYRTQKVIKSAGGKGINVARVINTLGRNTNLIAFKGGYAGEWIEKKVSEIGIFTKFINADRETRTNTNIIDKSSGTETEILEKGCSVTQTQIKKIFEIYDELIDKTEILVCSGSLCDGIPDDFYCNLISRARIKGVFTILDSNGKALKSGINAKPSLIKPNLRELEQLLGRKIEDEKDIISSAKQIVYKGVESVIVSMGKDGAYFIQANSVTKADALQVKVANTIGSGDSMVAGMAAGIDSGMNMMDSFALSMACGTSNAQNEGIGVVDLDEVEEIKGKIKLDSICI
jgi:tagatose 6-phosphate kinase